MNVTMTALMTNQEKYRKGEVAGITVEFPTTKEAMQEALRKIGVDGIRCREVFLTEHDSNLSGFCHCINQGDSADELNYLCRLLSDMTDTELATFRAVVEYGEHNENATDLINLALNVEHYDFYIGVDNDKELGHIYADEMGDIEIPEDVRPYFDFEAYGRKVRKEDKGCFVNDGYLIRSVGEFEERYHGPEDIPPEHRVFEYPKLNIRERMAAYSELSGRASQRSKPAPEPGRGGTVALWDTLSQGLFSCDEEVIDW